MQRINYPISVLEFFYTPRYFMSMNQKTLLVTGGAGFIGGHFVDLALEKGHEVVVVDAMTYAASPELVESWSHNPNFHFEKARIEDHESMKKIFEKWTPHSVINFAAESHVDRSIEDPKEFIYTNFVGTYCLLNLALHSFKKLSEAAKPNFRFLQVSTDEVYGDLEVGDPKFTEQTPYSPSSPYSASKAGADHLARAWFRTFNLPTIVTNCSNNYGPRQFPEKLIPITIKRALSGEPIAVYGQGENIRDWIHVEDHCQGLYLALTQGHPGETYCFGGGHEETNIKLVRDICAILDDIYPQKNGQSYSEQIQFVTDRAGHDFRYAIDDSKAEKELGYNKKYSFKSGLTETIRWYLKN